MKVAAHFGFAWSQTVCRLQAEPSVPRQPYPHTADVAAIEMALANLLRRARQDAAARGTVPEVDIEAELFRRAPGDLAALILNPVHEAYALAAQILKDRHEALVPPDERPAAADRLNALIGPGTRYAADTRPRH